MKIHLTMQINIDAYSAALHMRSYLRRYVHEKKRTNSLLNVTTM
jgi:hypothetical protein